MGSKILNNSESLVKSDSTVKANVSSDIHERKLQTALQRFLDYGKVRKKINLCANLEIMPAPE